MHSIRIHTVDAPRPSSSRSSSSAAASAAAAAAAEDSPSSSYVPPQQPSDSRAPSLPRVLESRGIIHLFRNGPSSSSTSTTSTSADPLPASRGSLLFVVAVPGSLTVDDFLRFCCGSHAEHFLEARVIRNDAIDDRYSVLIELRDQKTADSFYLDFNGWRFPHAQEEICHALFVTSVEYTDSADVAMTPVAGSAELPTCPVCLERLDQDISGVASTGCDHSFQCSCISKLANSSCMVCQFCRENSEKPTCCICETSENLWICIICGFVGCGRYKEGHAIRHWKSTQHCYSLDLATQRIWDYVGDTYVHRLNLSRSDNKMARLKHRCRSADGTCEACDFDDDWGINGALFGSKVEAVVDDYSHLLASQLDNQRQYYESQLMEANSKKEALIADAVEKALNAKLHYMQIEIDKLMEERNAIAVMNEKLVKNQNHLKEKFREVEERERLTLKLKDEKIRDLEEEIRDITVYIEAQKALSGVADADAEDIREGTLVCISETQDTSDNRRTSRASRRRH